MNPDHITRYRLELDIVERDGALGHRRAIGLLQSEFARAINASYLMQLSADDIEVGTITRSIPHAGVTRYSVVLELVERTPMTDEQAAELLRREFRRAENAGQFLRIAGADVSVTLAARQPALAATSAGLRAA
jgi:EAL domain-containing protein (putative c-di-GMP-specific phosphodiesterase class I)